MKAQEVIDSFALLCSLLAGREHEWTREENRLFRLLVKWIRKQG
jgi:hypothetical protein